MVGLSFKDEDGFSVFPMNALQILYLNLLSSSPPALALGQEESTPDIMLMPPKPSRTSVFTAELVIDFVYYGVVSGLLCLVNFMLIAYVLSGATGNPFGSQCNHAYGTNCEIAMRARGATFVTATLMFLVHAYNSRHPRLSVFQMPRSRSNFLLYTVFGGAILLIPVFYIDVYVHRPCVPPHQCRIRIHVFEHDILPIDWLLVFAALVLYEVSVELYKLGKRRKFGVTTVSNAIHTL